MNNIVSIQNLAVDFYSIDGISKVIDGISIYINQGEVVGLVGETGCGKSVTAKTLLGILPMPPGRIRQGDIFFLDQNLFNIRKAERDVLKQEFAYIPQDPMTSLNPVFTIGTTMLDLIIWKKSQNKIFKYLLNRRKRFLIKEAMNYASDLLEKVHLSKPISILRKYPIELSGGMRQRVLLATAMIGKPKLFVADEPTTALDVTIQKGYIYLIKENVMREELSGLYITHNLGVARILCNRIYVMYAGRIVESGRTSELLDYPIHPYTKGLVNAIPKITGEEFQPINGHIPDYLNPPKGCRFHPRCHHRMEVCSHIAPNIIEVKPRHFVSCWLYNSER